uniref:Uncharacterized protein n=2 Tax=Rhodosorus marinus TaxID=101924 RepID=A0A7S3EE02_9RHOD|mmetsp:Transcript_24974/g.98669  ORF Transcript_24974/g.98669 Transcript_24974/m.98669 type:complete len:208 (+) Transcript_24974:273-896(+)
MGDLEKAEELLVELRRVDRLSHPGVIGLVEEYLRCGGDEKKVRQALVDGFVGYEAACAQLSIWLTALKKDSGEASEEVANSCLENLVMQKFDPKLADQIFLETGKAPDWLESMIRDPFWCSVLRKLNSSAKSSAVLDYAIRRMDMAISVSDIGGTSGNGMNVTALEDPHVFSTLLAEGVLGVTSATTDAGFHVEMNRLAKLACFDER